MIYEFARTRVHDSEGGRVALIHQQPGEYRGFTGLSLVCKTIHQEYTPTLRYNKQVSIRCEHVSAYINFFYPVHGGDHEHGDVQIVFTAYAYIKDPHAPPGRRSPLESPQLNLTQLFELRWRYPMVEVTFLCYIQYDAREKPVYWPQLTEDFKELLYARVGETSTLPLVPSEMACYFSQTPHRELTLVSRWPQPEVGALVPKKPAIILNVKYKWGALENLDFPFGSMRSTGSLASIAQTLWDVKKIHDSVFPLYDDPCNNGRVITLERKDDDICPSASDHDRKTIKRFICANELCHMIVREWCLRFQPAGSGLIPLDNTTAAAHARADRLASPLSEGPRHKEHNHGEEIPAVFQELLVEAGYTKDGARELGKKYN